MIFRLIVLNGEREGRQITVERTPMVIGQDPASAICITDEEVARCHASIVHNADDKLVIHDLGSMNRVLVNGRAVAEAQLKHGDTIELGRIRLLVQAMVQAEVDAPTKTDSVEDDLLPRHRFLVGFIMNGLLVAALAVAVVTWHRSNRSRRTPQPTPNPLALDTYLATPGGVLNAPSSNANDATIHLPPVTPNDMLAVTGSDATAASAPPTMHVFTASIVATPPIATEKLNRIEQELASLRVSMQRLSNNPPAIVEVAHVTNAPEAAVITTVPIQPTPTPPPQPEPESKPPPRIGILVPHSKPSEAAALLKVALTDLRQNKFPATEEFDEMRVVSADLQATPANAAITALRVEVAFFDRLDRDGAIIPSQAIVTIQSVRPTGKPGAGQYSASATYVAPRRPEKSPPRGANYYGFAARVYDGKRLLAADARPRNLLDEAGVFRKIAP